MSIIDHGVESKTKPMKEKEFETIADILHNHGIVGVNDYVEKQRWNTNVRWSLFLLLIIPLIALWFKTDADAQIKAHSNDLKASFQVYCDSVVTYCDNKYNVAERVLNLKNEK